MANVTLLHFDGAHLGTTITDDGTSPQTFTANGSVVTSTAQKQFGTASLASNGGAGDYAQADMGPLPASGGWTIDFWRRPFSGGTDTMFHWYDTAGGCGIELRHVSAGGNKLRLDLSSNGSSNDIASNAAGTAFIDAGVWTHIALVRDDAAGKYYVYVNGVKDFEVTSASQVFSGIDRLRLFSNAADSTQADGWIDEFRVSDDCEFPGGTTFTPASAAYETGGAPNDGTGTLTLPSFSMSAEMSANPFDMPMPQMEGAGLTGEVATGAATLPMFSMNNDAPQVTSTGEGTLTIFEMGGWMGDFIDSSMSATLPMFSSEAAFTAGNDYSTSRTFLMPEFEGALENGQSMSMSVELSMFDTEANGYHYHTEGALELPLAIMDGRMTSIASITFESDVFTADGFDAWTLNLKTGALTQYPDFGANSLARFNGEYLAANDNGIFALAGDKDASQPIPARVRLALTDLGIPNLKRIEELFVSYRSEGTLTLRIITDNGLVYEYPLAPTGRTGVYQARVKTGKGLKVGYFQVEIVNVDGCAFDLDAIRLRPALLSRSIGQTPG